MNDDTIKLLRECNAGIKMGISAINDVLENIEDNKLRDILKDSREKHERMGDETHELLTEYHDDGKEPAAIAAIMSKVKTNMKMMKEKADKAAADLITDGCNMGIKSLYKYFNQYPTAEEKVKKLAQKIIDEEEKLRGEMRVYL